MLVFCFPSSFLCQVRSDSHYGYDTIRYIRNVELVSVFICIKVLILDLCLFHKYLPFFGVYCASVNIEENINAIMLIFFILLSPLFITITQRLCWLRSCSFVFEKVRVPEILEHVLRIWHSIICEKLFSKMAVPFPSLPAMYMRTSGFIS